MALVLNPNWPLVGLQAAFNVDPNSGTGTPAWVDLTGRMNSGWDCRQGRQYELNTVETGVGTWELGNKDEALNPANLASPYQQAITPTLVQSGTVTTVAGTSAALPVPFTTTATAGNTLLLAVSSTQTVAAPPGYTVLASATSASNGNLYVFGKTAIGRESGVTVVPAAASVLAVGWVEYSGVTPVWPQVDQTASARRNASSGNTIGTGTTAATTQPLELVVEVAGPHNYAAASAPTSPVWTSGATNRLTAATTSATAASNCAVFLADRVVSATGTQVDTCTWTNNSTDAGGLVITLKAILTLVPYRPVRYWEACRSDGVFPMWSGNFLNDGVNSWNNTWVPSGSLSDTAGFEGGTVGTWTAAGGATVANSAVRAHDGTKSLLVTWPTAGTGVASAKAAIPPTRTGVTYTLSAWVWVASGPAVQLVCDGAASTASVGTGAWQRLTVTFTADDNIAGIAVTTTGASTSGQQVWVDSVQLEAAATASAWAATGPTVYPVWSGYFERYSESWKHAGQYGWTKTTLVDPLVMLVRARLDDCMTEDALQDLPAFYWPLDDAPGDSLCRPRQPFAGALFHVGLGFADFTYAAAGGPGVDGDKCLQTANPPTGYLTAGFDPAPATTPSSGYQYAPIDTGSGVTWECWFQAVPGTTGVVIVEAAAAGNNEALTIQLNTQGMVLVESRTGATLRYSITDTGVANEGAWHYVAVTEKATAGTVTATLYVDARVVGTATRAASTAMTTLYLTVAAAPYSTPTNSGLFNGKLTRAAIYQTAITGARAMSHSTSGAGFPWDTTGARVGRLIGWAPWRGVTAVDAGRTDVAVAKGLEGTTAADAGNACAVTENGVLVATPDGVLRFWGRDRYYLKTVNSAVLGENTAGGEIPYQGDIGFDTDPQLIYNDVTVTPASNNAQEVTDALSQRRYGAATGGASTIHRFDSDALDLARHMIRRYKEPQPRPSTITIDLASNPGIWAQVLALRFGDRVRVTRRSQGVTTSIDGFIEQISHAGGPGKRTVQLRVSPVDPAPAFILGDATYGVINGPGILVY